MYSTTIYRSLLRRSAALFVAFFLCHPLAVADRLVLSNGDSISGELVEIKDGFLLWKSDMMGELKIDQGHVQIINSDKRVDVTLSSGALQECWMYAEKNKQLLHCDEGVQVLPNWKRVIAMGEEVAPRPFVEHKGNVLVALESTSGNTELEKYDLEGAMEWRFETVRHTISFEYDNEKTQDEETKNNWEVGYAHDWFVTDQFFWTARASYEEDEFKDIDNRVELGGGFGYEFIKTRFVTLSGTAGIDYVEEDFGAEDSRNSTVLRLGSSASWKPTVDGIEIYHKNEFKQSMKTGDDYLFETKTGVSFPIAGGLKSVLEYEWDYKNLPAEGKDTIDSKWSFGVKYDW